MNRKKNSRLSLRFLKAGSTKKNFLKIRHYHYAENDQGKSGRNCISGNFAYGNIARLFLLDSEIPSLLKGLYLMCGKFSEYDFKNWYREDDAGDGDFLLLSLIT